MTGIIATIIVLGVLIVVHEFGHFIVAKKLGVGVLKFSVGFGPTLLGKTVDGTEYVLSAIPLGGFVKMVGEDPDSEEPVDEAISFSHQKLWKRCAIVLAGPFFNLLFAFAALTFINLAYGMPLPNELPEIGVVSEEGPAAGAGFLAGDIVTAIDGEAIVTWEDLAEKIRGSEGRDLAIEVQRGGDAVRLRVAPEKRESKNLYGEIDGDSYYAIGILQAPGSERENVGVVESVKEGFLRTVWLVKMVVGGFYRMITFRISASELGGPLLIGQAVSRQAQVGLESLISLTSFISVNLGVLNLLPIPVLDGGHLLFFLIEGVRRRPLDLRQREMAQQVGLVILIGLMVFAFYNDIGRFLNGSG